VQTTHTSTNLQKYKSRNPLKQLFLRRFMDRLLTVLADAPKPERVLEVGCGEGMVLKAFAERWPDVALTGVDISPPALEVARELNPTATIHTGNAYDLQFANNAFDHILCLEVLEHLETLEKAMDELVRVAGGRITISVPHEPWFRLGNLAVLSHASTWGNPPDHRNHWRVRTLIPWIAEWLDVERVETAFPWIIVSGTPRAKGGSHA